VTGRLRPEHLLVVPLLAGAALLAANSGAVQREALLMALALLAPLPIAVRLWQRRFDPFEPIVLLAVGVIVLFVVRPIAHLAYDQMWHRDRRLEPGFDRALLMAFIGVAGLYLGYALGAGRRLARRLPELRQDWRPERLTAFAIGLVVVGLVLFAGFIQQVGGLAVARSFLFARTHEEGEIFARATAYFYLGPFLAIPAALLIMESAARGRKRILLVLAGLAAFLVVALTGPRGDRIWLLTMLMSLAVLPYLRTGRRPRVLSLAAVFVVVFAFGVTFLAEVRTPTARQASPAELFARTLENPFRGVEDFVLGPDSEMFAIMAMEAEEIPARKPYAPGVTLGSLVAGPIPDGLWPGKPESADIQIYSHLFPAQAQVTKAGTAPSMLGGFYYDLGFPGVALGALLVGLLFRVLFEYLRAHPRNASVRLLYAAALPLTFVLLRGNPTDTLPRALYLVVPVLAAVWWASRRTVALPARRPLSVEHA
jgi:hypothetical protein